MIKLNCLASDLENAKEIYDVTNGNVLIGMLTKSFSSDKEAIKEMIRWSDVLDGNISIGLGQGDPKQSYMVSRIASKVWANHVNQVFPEVPATRAMSLNENIIINSLVSPSGIIGKVIISTGSLSSDLEEKGIIPVRVAAQMIKEMGGNSIKFFNMKNLKSIQEFIPVAKACAEFDLIMEMTGGLNLTNIESFLKICHKFGVKNVIPHVYGSIINKKTGKTDVGKVQKLLEIFKRYY